VAGSSLITGLFKDFFLMFSIIIIHEIGHLMAASYYNFNIYKIYLYPFGGFIKFNDKLNRTIKEEFIILISGPLFQILFFCLMSIMHKYGLVSNNTFDIIVNYHYSLLIFNLLPIFPLDGSKFINLILSKFLSFKRAHLSMIFLSYVTLLVAFITSKYISFNVNIYLLLCLLLFKLIEESKNHKTIYNRFLLERYLYNFGFKKRKLIKGSRLSLMRRDCKHLFIVDNKEITEREMLRKRYNQRR
jgi:stage IV sporulation protein FB